MTDEALTLSTDEARDQLDALVVRAQSGERVVLTRDGQPVAEIIPVDDAADTPTPEKMPVGSLRGLLKGKIWIADDFDKPGAIWDDLHG